MFQEVLAGSEAAAVAQTDAVPVNRGRRITDKLLSLFHESCDQGRYDVAKQLLAIVEQILRTPHKGEQETNRRKAMESLVAAYERLWHLRH